jgi:hypothetical protein
MIRFTLGDQKRITAATFVPPMYSEGTNDRLLARSARTNPLGEQKIP